MDRDAELLLDQPSQERFLETKEPGQEIGVAAGVPAAPQVGDQLGEERLVGIEYRLLQALGFQPLGRGLEPP